jgi:hypothetical protein
MSSRNGSNGVGRDAAVMAKVAAAERFARALVVAFGALDDLGLPLTDVQKIAMVQAALLEFDGFEAQLDALDDVGRVLRGVHWPDA